MSTLFLNGQSYSFDSLKQQGILLLSETDKVHEPSFQLIHDWLNNKQSFFFSTSGSTGVPKLIELSRAQMEASARGTIEALSLTSAEHFFVCMNTAFIGGAMLVVRALMVNGTITLQEPTGNPLQLLPEEHPYTFASFAPLQLFPVLQNIHNEKLKLNRFKQVLVGGGDIYPLLKKELTTLNVKAYHTYGMTETVSHIALKELGKQVLFKALPGIQLKTDDRDCLTICCAATNNEWVQTNDVVNLIDSHSFIILGRADDVINTGGIKIWPGKVEQVIRETLGATITNVFVFGLPDTKLGQQLIAVIETHNEANNLLSVLPSQLGAILAKYEVPKQYFTLRRFSYTPTGKVNKAETLKMIGL
ncbi:MAG: AMP-binding protein [Bacteroidota bacterium]